MLDCNQKAPLLAAWIKQNKGNILEMFPSKEAKKYTVRHIENPTKPGETMKVLNHRMKDEEAFKAALIDYIDKSIVRPDLPQVEFSNCYIYFKIY